MITPHAGVAPKLQLKTVTVEPTAAPGSFVDLVQNTDYTIVEGSFFVTRTFASPARIYFV